VTQLEPAQPPRYLIRVGPGDSHVLEGGGMPETVIDLVRLTIDDDRSAPPERVEKHLVLIVYPYLDDLPAADPQVSIADNLRVGPMMIRIVMGNRASAILAAMDHEFLCVWQIESR
jgi:hypothetical protein